MPVTATFLPDQVQVLPNVASTLKLRLYNDDPTAREFTLDVSGALHDHVVVSTPTSTLEPHQIVDVTLNVFVPTSVEAGLYTVMANVNVKATQPHFEFTGSTIHQEANDDDTLARSLVDQSAIALPSVVTAMATVTVATHTDYTINLLPTQSRSSASGRHVVRATNAGNTTAQFGLTAEHASDDIHIVVNPATLTVPPGAAHDASVRVRPAKRHWGGPPRDHDFVLRATSAEGRVDEMIGVYQQRPRVPSWLGPAAAGAAAALFIGAVTWLAVLRPWVEDTADQAAADAIELDRAALRERIDELEAAAAEASELPLGSPIDIRLDVAPANGGTDRASSVVDPGTVVSITDVVFQNPDGAVGTVSLRRGEEVILQSELANFRDFDLHFVAPYVFDENTEIVFEVECRTPAAGQQVCPVGVSLVGFVDDVD